ncbi:hypothetical protein [Streptomyces sp. NPDC059861]|uniref:hypothetical protein n=1 Tax=Streptomyces sp. NPDC059861 TaxID=3346974 RepID=UPI00365BC811
MDGGRVVTAGPPREVLAPELLAGVCRVDAEVTEHPGTGVPHIKAPEARDVPQGRGDGGDGRLPQGVHGDSGLPRVSPNTDITHVRTHRCRAAAWCPT